MFMPTCDQNVRLRRVNPYVGTVGLSLNERLSTEMPIPMFVRCPIFDNFQKTGLWLAFFHFRRPILTQFPFGSGALHAPKNWRNFSKKFMSYGPPVWSYCGPTINTKVDDVLTYGQQQSLIADRFLDQYLIHYITLFYQDDMFGIYQIEDGDGQNCGNGFATGQELLGFFNIGIARFRQKTGLPYLPHAPPIWRCKLEWLVYASLSPFKMNTRYEPKDYMESRLKLQLPLNQALPRFSKALRYEAPTEIHFF